MQDLTNSDQLVRQGQDAPRLLQGVGSTLPRYTVDKHTTASYQQGSARVISTPLCARVSVSHNLHTTFLTGTHLHGYRVEYQLTEFGEPVKELPPPPLVLHGNHLHSPPLYRGSPTHTSLCRGGKGLRHDHMT